MSYLLHVLTLVGIYSIVGSSLYILLGRAGLLSLAHAAFFGLGAYIVGLSGPYTDWWDFALATAGTGLVGAAVAAISRNLHDDFLVLASFAFQAVGITVGNNWIALTNGPLGIAGIAKPRIFHAMFDTPLEFLGLVITTSVLVHFLVWRLARSPYGRLLDSIRIDRVYTATLGKPVEWLRISVFAISTALAGLAGGLYASYITYIDPSSFGLGESVFMLSIIIVGGVRNRWGGLLGAVLLISIPELLRLFPVPTAVVGNVRQIFYAASLVMFLLIRPEGLLRPQVHSFDVRTPRRPNRA